MRKVCSGRPSLETLAISFSVYLPTEAAQPCIVLGFGCSQHRRLGLDNVITEGDRIAGAGEVAFMAKGLWEVFPEIVCLMPAL